METKIRTQHIPVSSPSYELEDVSTSPKENRCGNVESIKSRCFDFKKYWFPTLVLILVLILFVANIVFYVILSVRSGDLAVSQDSLIKGKDFRLSLGMRNDYLLQDCGQDTHLKQSFPNIDYALLGYDILKGFPLAEGHDPGFTLPIFKTDYSSGGQSGDCRFSVPEGLVIVPDVSCVTSFVSEIFKSQRAYAESLSVNVGAQGGGFGVSFSSSVGYRKKSSELESNEKVYVISTARCAYYNSKLVTSNAPPFNKDFLKWAKRLQTTVKKDVYMSFFDTYGTHVPVNMLFGARYTLENSMTKKEFESKESSGMNIAMSASYSGKFSVGASFSLDSSQEEMAKQFMKNVETKTVTVGAAPPADGDAMKWASSVQSNPVPVYYELLSIEKLFTSEFMQDLDIDYDSVFSKLSKFKKYYESYLRFKEDCLGVDERYVVLYKTDLRDVAGQSREKGSLSDCLSVCENDSTCKGFTINDNTCDFADGEGPRKRLYASTSETSTSFIIWGNNTSIKFEETAINGITFMKDPSINTLSECEESCSKIDRCFAMTFRESCRLFEKKKVFSLEEDKKASATIFSKCGKFAKITK